MNSSVMLYILSLFCVQIIMAILMSWLLCFIFTVTDVFPPEVDKYGFYARTDARQGILVAAPWFKVPYPCECVYLELWEQAQLMSLNLAWCQTLTFMLKL